MTSVDVVARWIAVVGGVLILAAMIIRSWWRGTFLLFAPTADGPSWATVVTAVLITVYAGQLWRHHRRHHRAP